MSNDLSRILNEWQFDPEAMMVRIITGDDGRDRLQLRVDLGVLQMELEGRPDGFRPEGAESWLAFYEQQQQAHDEQYPDSAPLMLSEDDCIRLWREGVQYYHRYLSLWHLERYEQCARDTARNLRLFEFVRAYAQDERHKLQFDQWRPYVLMMHTRAVATPLLSQNLNNEALRVIESGIEAIREYFDEYNQPEQVAECAELSALEHWRDEVLNKEEFAGELRPQNTLQMLRSRLEAAILAEEFEEAARLRDLIRDLADDSPKDRAQ